MVRGPSYSKIIIPPKDQGCVKQKNKILGFSNEMMTATTLKLYEWYLTVFDFYCKKTSQKTESFQVVCFQFVFVFTLISEYGELYTFKRYVV